MFNHQARTEVLNRQAEANEKHSKDEKKHRREQRLADSKNSLLCSHPSFSFRAHNIAGLANHVRQHHSTISRILCPSATSYFTNRGFKPSALLQSEAILHWYQ